MSCRRTLRRFVGIHAPNPRFRCSRSRHRRPSPLTARGAEATPIKKEPIRALFIPHSVSSIYQVAPAFRKRSSARQPVEVRRSHHRRQCSFCFRDDRDRRSEERRNCEDPAQIPADVGNSHRSHSWNGPAMKDRSVVHPTPNRQRPIFCNRLWRFRFRSSSSFFTACRSVGSEHCLRRALRLRRASLYSLRRASSYAPAPPAQNPDMLRSPDWSWSSSRWRFVVLRLQHVIYPT